eukprot:944431-Prorocentrum_minimum.AAC.1
MDAWISDARATDAWISDARATAMDTWISAARAMDAWISAARATDAWIGAASPVWRATGAWIGAAIAESCAAGVDPRAGGICEFRPRVREGYHALTGASRRHRIAPRDPRGRWIAHTEGLFPRLGGVWATKEGGPLLGGGRMGWREENYPALAGGWSGLPDGQLGFLWRAFYRPCRLLGW